MGNEDITYSLSDARSFNDLIDGRSYFDHLRYLCGPQFDLFQQKITPFLSGYHAFFSINLSFIYLPVKTGQTVGLLQFWLNNA
jgi:hypothetical protein